MSWTVVYGRIGQCGKGMKKFLQESHNVHSLPNQLKRSSSHASRRNSLLHQVQTRNSQKRTKRKFSSSPASTIALHSSFRNFSGSPDHSHRAIRKKQIYRSYSPVLSCSANSNQSFSAQSNHNLLNRSINSFSTQSQHSFSANSRHPRIIRRSDSNLHSDFPEIQKFSKAVRTRMKHPQRASTRTVYQVRLRHFLEVLS